MRTFVLVLFALCLLGGGAYLMFLASLHPTFYGVLRFGCAGAFPFILGAFLLWDDVLKLMIRNLSRKAARK
jgi:membrane-bound ClpP family serine protease